MYGVVMYLIVVVVTLFVYLIYVGQQEEKLENENTMYKLRRRPRGFKVRTKAKKAG